MVRKRHKPRKKDRQPILENFMQKVATKAGDNAKYLVNPPGEISMSDAISQLIEPYKDDASDYKAFRTLVTLGCTAWNASILRQEQRAEMLDKMLSAVSGGKKDRDEMFGFMQELMGRKERLFPHVTRMIVDFNVTDRGDDFHIAVASTLSRPPEQPGSEK